MESGPVAGYEVLGEVGRGSAATVLRVRRIADGATYALKILTADAGSGPAALCREAALLAGVDHPGVVQVHEVGAAAGRPYLVMDFVDGQPLARLLDHGALGADRVVAIALDLAETLSAFHRATLVHRDLKPDNIMITPNGAARLIDFGLTGRDTGTAEPGSDAAVGTLLYASPEQAGMLTRPVDQRSDLYSLGVVLYECLAGTPPFVGSDVGELLRAHAVMPPPDLLRRAPDTPPALAAIVATLLAKEPDDRYQTAADLTADLRALVAGAPVLRGPAAHGEPTIGRAGELAALTDRWHAARRGDGGVAVLRGGSGSGKTRLAREFAARVAADGGTALFATAAPDDPVPMAPLRDAIDAYLRSVPDRQRGAVHERIRASAGGAAPLLATLSAGLTAVLGPAEPVEEEGPSRFPLAVAEFLATLAGAGLLLVVDDVHRADAATRQVLVHLRDSLAGTPLLVLLTGDDTGEADLDLALPPLSDDEVLDLVRTLLPGVTADDPLVRHVVVRATGNPLVVREYLRTVMDAGLLRPSWGRWELDEAGLDALELPRDALGLLLTRLADLDAGAVDLLATAALMGVRFRPPVIAAVHGVPTAHAIEVLGDAAARGLVEPRAGGRFAFLHMGIRDALAATLDDAATKARHAALAQALTTLPVPDDNPATERLFAVARHYVAAGAAAPADRAIAACTEAGTLAQRTHAPDLAATFLGYAVELDPAPGVAVLHPLGTALWHLGRFAEATRWLDRALKQANDPLVRTEIIVALSDVYWSGWRTVDGSAMITHGLTELGLRPPRNRFLAAVGTLAMVLAAMVMHRTGLGFGTARGERRRRCELAAGLHARGFVLAGQESRIGQLLMHGLRGVYWANRVGSGATYARCQCLFGAVANVLRLRRVADAAFARMNADPSTGEPMYRASGAFAQALTRYMSGQTPQSDLVRAMEEHSQWLDIGVLAEGVFALTLDSLSAGRNGEAAHVWALAQRRLATAAGERSMMSMVPVLIAAAQGRHADAASHLAHLERDMVGANGTALDLYRYTSVIFTLYEQREIGKPFDEAVAGYASVGMSPMAIPGSRRITLFQIAMGRIAQYRSTGQADHLARARAAVADLGKGPRDAVSGTWRTIAGADLLAATGAPGKAVRLLARHEVVHRPDAPLLAFERARVLARAYAALDAPAEARRHAQVALGIAEDEGWPHRAGWVAAEFPAARPSDRSLGAQTRAGGSTTLGWSDDRRRLRALEHLGAAASRVLDPEALARVALDEIIRLLHAERAFLFLTEDHAEDRVGDRLLAHLGRDADGSDLAALTGYSTSLVERVRVSREPLVMTGTEEGVALGAHSVVLHGLRSVMIAPLLLDDRLLGVVYLDSKVAKGIFTADDAGILIALAGHIAVALETARAAQLEISEQAARRQRDLADGLRGAFEAMSDTLDPETVLARLLEGVGALVPNDGVWLELPDGVRFLDSDATPTRQPIPDDRSVARLPLRTRNATVGTLVLASADAEQHLELAAALVAQGMTAYDNASLFARVNQLATLDELTGVANRRRFFERAEREFATAAGPLVVMMLDVDHFKRVNDTHGHASGDDVIREVARRLGEAMRESDVLGRYGGEEFAIVVPDTDLATGRRLAERLRERVAAEPVRTRTGPLRVTVSIGVTATLATEDVATVLARADAALYEAKQSGRDRTCVALESGQDLAASVGTVEA